MSLKYDVAGVGNAIVDVIASVDDRFLLNHRIAKGGMTLIDELPRPGTAEGAERQPADHVSTA